MRTRLQWHDASIMALSERGRLAEIDPGRLRLRIGNQTLHALVAALSGLLVAAERLSHVAVIETVHPDDAGLEIAHRLVCDGQIPGPDRGSEAVDRVVRDLQALRHAVDLDGRRHRSEDLLLRDGHAVLHARKESRIDISAGQIGGVAAELEPRALALTLGDVAPPPR